MFSSASPTLPITSLLFLSVAQLFQQLHPTSEARSHGSRPPASARMFQHPSEKRESSAGGPPLSLSPSGGGLQRCCYWLICPRPESVNVVKTSEFVCDADRNEDVTSSLTSPIYFIPNKNRSEENERTAEHV